MNSSWNLTGMSSNGFSVFETILHFLFLPVICLAGYHSACNINTYIEPWYANTYPIAAACLSICTSTFLLNLCRQNYIYIKSEREHFLLACWCIAALIEFETILGLVKGKKKTCGDHENTDNITSFQRWCEQRRNTSKPTAFLTILLFLHHNESNSSSFNSCQVMFLNSSRGIHYRHAFNWICTNLISLVCFVVWIGVNICSVVWQRPFSSLLSLMPALME